MRNIINNLPDSSKWTIHNVVAHPLSGVLFQLGFRNASNMVHDNTASSVEEDELEN